MRRKFWRSNRVKSTLSFALLLFTMSTCGEEAVGKTIDVRLRICGKTTEEKTINRENLLRIKRFILDTGQRETYGNVYNNNPACHAKRFDFYLNPDTRQKNIDCDPNKSDFNSLTIRSKSGGKDQYRTVEFIGQHAVYITVNWPTDDLTVGQVRQFVEDAIKELLAELDQNKPIKTPKGRL